MKSLGSVVLLIAIVLANHVAFPQDVPGCTDPQANNYDPSATVNDGSCTYNPTFYNPEFQYLLPAELDESSGLVFFDDGIWSVNDSGNDPVLFKLDTVTGELLQEITVINATNVDWESLAQDTERVYIGDFGNNNGDRDDLGIYIIEKSDLPETGNGSVQSAHISFTYPDYPGKIKKRNDNNFDCEAMVAIGDSLYLFSKNWGDKKTKLYRLPKTAGEFTAELLYTYNTNGLVTGASYNEESEEVTLIGYSSSTTIPFFWLLFDYHENRLFSGNKRRIDLLNLTAGQTEAIAYREGKNGSISMEENAFYNQSVHRFYTGTWTNPETTGINVQEKGTFDFTLQPNPVGKKKLIVSLTNVPGGNLQVKLFDTSGRLLQIKKYSLRPRDNRLEVKIDVSGLVAGVYIARVEAGNRMVEKKFIKQ